MFGCGIAPKSAEKPGGIIPTGTNHTGTDRQTARAEKNQTRNGRAYNGGGNCSKQIFFYARERYLHRITTGNRCRQQAHPGDPIPLYRETHSNGTEGQTKEPRDLYA